MKTQDGTGLGVSFLVGDGFLIKGLAEECECGAVHAGAGLHDMRNEAFLGGLVEVVERLAGVLDVFSEIVIGAVGDAFEFAHAEWELVFEVVGLLRVERSFSIRNVIDVDLRAGNADVLVEFEPLLEPVVGELHAVLRAAEILDLHLLEFARAENVVAGIDLVAKGFSDLCDAEGQLLTGGVEHIAEIHKDRLRCLGAEIDQVVLAFNRASVAFEHEIEIARFREVAAPALRAVFFAVFLGQLVGAVAGVADFAVHHRIAECLLVP